jgi:hypothetical protein
MKLFLPLIKMTFRPHHLLPLAASFALAASSAHSATLLAVDFGGAATPVQAGFVGQSAASAIHSTAAGNVTVVIAGHQGIQGLTALTSAVEGYNMYNDGAFKNTGTMTLTLSGPGISANTEYRMSFWSAYWNVQVRNTSFAATAGTTGTTLGPIATAYLPVPTGFDDPAYSATGTFTSDGSGVLTFSITGSGARPMINGFKIETVGGVAVDPQITSITSVGSGVWELTLKGEANTAFEFRSSTTLDFNPGTQVVSLMPGVPAVGTISGTNSEILTTDGSGDATVRMTLTGNPADFVRAQTVP